MPGRCREILQILGSQGFGATQVVERHRLRVDAWWPRWTTPVAVVWEGWRAAGWIQVFSWLTWIWGVALFGVRRPREDPA
jgi:hypothetical protein